MVAVSLVSSVALDAAQLRVRQPDDSVLPQEVDPQSIRLTGRSDERTTWVCVSTPDGKKWAKQAAWMATIPAAPTRAPRDPGYTTGSGNGFGGMSLLDIVKTCP